MKPLQLIALALFAAVTACGPASEGEDGYGDETNYVNPGDQRQEDSLERAARDGCAFAARCVASEDYDKFHEECVETMWRWFADMPDEQSQACAHDILDIVDADPECDLVGYNPPSCPDNLDEYREAPTPEYSTN